MFTTCPSYQTFQALVWTTCHWSKDSGRPHTKMSCKGSRVLENNAGCFKSTNKVTRTEEQLKGYNEPMYDSVSHVATERINEVSHGKYSKPRTLSKTYNGLHFISHNNSHFDTPDITNNHQFSRNHGRSQFSHSQNNLKCYYCKGKHYIRDCDKFTQDKDKYKLKPHSAKMQGQDQTKGHEG